MSRQLDGSFTSRACAAVSVAMVLAVAVSASARAQGVGPGAMEKFDAASIKQNKDPVPGLVPHATFELRPGRFRASQATLQELITVSSVERLQRINRDLVSFQGGLTG